MRRHLERIVEVALFSAVIVALGFRGVDLMSRRDGAHAVERYSEWRKLEASGETSGDGSSSIHSAVFSD